MSSDYITVKTLVEGLIKLKKGTDTELCDYIDDTFLSIWEHETRRADPKFLKDIRGIIIALVRVIAEIKNVPGNTRKSNK